MEKFKITKLNIIIISIAAALCIFSYIQIFVNNKNMSADPNNIVFEEKIPSGKEILVIKLPKPMFVGTKENILSIPNLEQNSKYYKNRSSFYVPNGTILLSLGKSVMSSDNEPILGSLDMITDGDKEAADGSYVELGPFAQNITIDLESEFELYAILVWHFHKICPIAYFDIVVQVSNDKDFIEAMTIYNSDDDNTLGLGIGTDKNYIETFEGRLIDAKGIKGRYIRLYSNGNNKNDLNHYIEVEIWGK
jgi:hypothetical protein